MNSNSVSLIEAIPSVIKKIREIKLYPEIQNDNNSITRLLNAEEILESLKDGFKVSKIGIEFAKIFEKDLVNPDEPTEVIINNRFTCKFDPLRLLIIRGVMSSIWGVYDNITKICNILLGSDGDKKAQIGLLEFLSSNETKIPNPTLGLLRQKYRYPLSLSYQLRNSTIHRLPIICGRISSFFSNFVKDGFIIKTEAFKATVEFCQERDKVTDNEIMNNSFITNQVQCLIKLLETLQLYTDMCALELLEASLKPLPSNDHIYGI